MGKRGGALYQAAGMAGRCGPRLLKLGGDGSKSNAAAMQCNGFSVYEFRPDGSIGVVKPIDRSTGGSSSYEPTSLEGVPITGKRSGDHWIFESSAATKSRDYLLDYVRAPESSDELYPSTPLRVGDRWVPDPKAWVAILRDRGITQANLTATGWMELWSLSGQPEQPCATIHFDVTAAWPQDHGSAHFSGYIVRSLKFFQDLSVSVRGQFEKGPRVSLDIVRLIKTPETEKDLQKGSAEKSRTAERWLMDEASAGKTWAAFYLGVAYLAGSHGRALSLRGANAPDEALPYFNACNQILTYGPPLGKAEDAKAIISKAANTDARSLAVLGIMNLAAVGGAQYLENGLRFLQKAADEGDLLAKAFLAKQERQSNPEKARNLAKEAASGGNGIGMEEMAQSLESGDGGPADPKTAMEWRVKDSGKGVEKNGAKAFEWYKKAADQGDANAMDNVGLCYQKGEGVAKDRAEANRWLRTSSDKGYRLATLHLAISLGEGEGSTRDLPEAIRLLRSLVNDEDKWIAEGAKRALENFGQD